MAIWFTNIKAYSCEFTNRKALPWNVHVIQEPSIQVMHIHVCSSSGVALESSINKKRQNAMLAHPSCQKV